MNIFDGVVVNAAIYKAMSYPEGTPIEAIKADRDKKNFRFIAGYSLAVFVPGAIMLAYIGHAVFT